MNLSFGYNQGVPEGARAAWGARWIGYQDGHVDQVYNRQDADGEQADKDELFAWLRDTVKDQPHQRARELLRSYTMKTREDEEHVLYEDERGRVVANTNASAGYCYVAAFLTEGLTEEARMPATANPYRA